MINHTILISVLVWLAFGIGSNFVFATSDSNNNENEESEDKSTTGGSEDNENEESEDKSTTGGSEDNENEESEEQDNNADGIKPTLAVPTFQLSNDEQTFQLSNDEQNSESKISENTDATSECEPLDIIHINPSDPSNSNYNNAMDDNLETSWIQNERGSSIVLELEYKKNICNIDIAWGIGYSRSYNFQLEYSSAGSDYDNDGYYRSDGTTSDFERYDIPDISAKYIKISVDGNSKNTFANIAEVRVNGLA